MHHSHEEDERAYQRRRKLVSIFSLVVMLALFALISLTIGRRLLHFASDPAGLRAWAENQGIWGRLALVGIQILQVVVAVLPGEVVEIAAGYISALGKA